MLPILYAFPFSDVKKLGALHASGSVSHLTFRPLFIYNGWACLSGIALFIQLLPGPLGPGAAMSFILGKKVKMTQVWKDQKVIPVTVIKAAGNTVSLIRTHDKDGYSAVQVAMNGTKREFRTDAGSLKEVEVGKQIDVSSFKEGDKVRISGIVKGRGFQGVVKRHGFHGGPRTHGQKDRLRAPGSIGSTAFQRVVPGRRMGGRMGNNRVSQRNVIVVGIDTEKGLLMLKGAVPGAPGGLIEIRKA
jgi:large subunit ribosomal protein L3